MDGKKNWTWDFFKVGPHTNNTEIPPTRTPRDSAKGAAVSGMVALAVSLALAVLLPRNAPHPPLPHGASLPPRPRFGRSSPQKAACCPTRLFYTPPLTRPADDTGRPFCQPPPKARPRRLRCRAGVPMCRRPLPSDPRRQTSAVWLRLQGAHGEDFGPSIRPASHA